METNAEPHAGYALVRPRPAVFVTSLRLNDCVGTDVTLASESLQHTGSFKFRGAFNTAAQSSASHLVGVSSGNFGQALALACRLHGKRCTIVIPHHTSAVKAEAIRAYGADIDIVDTRVTPRLTRLRELVEKLPDAAAAYPSDGEPMLAGNESLGVEILSHEPAFDAVVAQVGGGGLVVGLIRAARRLVGSSRVDLQACKLEYSIVSPK